MFLEYRKSVSRCFSSTNITLFVVLFAVLAMRAPQDLFTPYLWAEDGSVLIQGSIYNGIKGIIVPDNGTYWVIQKSLALICYWLVLPFDNIEALPYIMQILSKVLATLSVMYFISDRFEWLVKERLHRFGICLAVVLLLPQNASDVLTCDTSLPFYFIFTTFLIGLDLVFGKKSFMPNIPQTLFLILFSLSSAAAPFVVVVVGIAALRWLINSIKTETLHRRAFIIEAIKLLLIFAAVFIQVQYILSSGRASGDIALVHRIVLNTKSFIFVPYLQKFHSWTAFSFGFLSWIIVWRVAKVPLKVIVYCGLFSWGFMLYSSMTGPADAFYNGAMTGRYVFTCFEISALLLGLATVRLLENKKMHIKYLGCASVLTICICALLTYNVQTIGAEFAGIYKVNSRVFEVKGQDRVLIPIGPWNPWIVAIPADISNKDIKDDIEFLVERTNGNVIGSENYGKLDLHLNLGGRTNVSGWARTSVDNQTFKCLFLKYGSTYTAAGSIQIRENFLDKKLNHNSFAFNLTSDYFVDRGITTLELLGETKDGQWHRGRFDIATTFIN
ncbi:MAG: hypothetical protein K0S39_4613 [Paenibacillus sp.]|jgi:hypothetical protein|nr:hypothetical protein [Paenibacillus sp.]